ISNSYLKNTSDSTSEALSMYPSSLISSNPTPLSSAYESADSDAFSESYDVSITKKTIITTFSHNPLIEITNPDMGWVIYENHPIRKSDGTLSTVRDYIFPGVEYVALMFSWADIEKSEGIYDFTAVDYAYDYWKSLDKNIHLRLSTESLLWWGMTLGSGIPGYVLAKIPADQKQLRTFEGLGYYTADARNEYYLLRLRAFLNAVDNHFSSKSRPVDLIDLRGYGLWGEWHSGYAYKDEQDRKQGLDTILKTWSGAFSDGTFLSLSYSWDPDREWLRNDSLKYTAYKEWGRFDTALQYPNIAFRRDGCGGAIFANDRAFSTEAYEKSVGPMMSEIAGGYDAARKDDPSYQKVCGDIIKDCLSINPNYINVYGWQSLAAKDFVEDRPDLISLGSRKMGYRIVPFRMSFQNTVEKDGMLEIDCSFTNYGAGKVVRDLRMDILLYDHDGNRISILKGQIVPVKGLLKGESSNSTCLFNLAEMDKGRYEIRMGLYDLYHKQYINLAVYGGSADSGYALGLIYIV
ncbi:MAG: hypothetical protein ACYC5K_11915, partial [Saccharofermentanales bacterium]